MPDVLFDSVGIPDNIMINAAMEGLVSLKEASRNLQVGIDKRVQGLEKIRGRMERKQKRIQHMMKTAPF